MAGNKHALTRYRVLDACFSNWNKEGLLKYAKGLVTLDEYLSFPEWNLDAIRTRAKKLYGQILSTWSEPWDVEEDEF